jgi:ATP-dependent RNA helicase RhlE
MNTFADLTLSPVLKGNLAKHGFVTPTPVQAQAIPPALEGKDLVATAQTGTGKTLAFVLPLLERILKNKTAKGAQALILSPTRELAVQISETFNKLAPGTGIRAAVVVGGLSERPQLADIKRGAQVIIATPGRLSDFIERRLVRLDSINLLILDEADRMLDMGFLPSITRIMGLLAPVRQTLFFSATIESSVAHLINKYLVTPVRIAIGSTTKTADQVDLHMYELDQDHKIGTLEHMLRIHEGTFMVFVRTKHGADRLAKRLEMDGISSTSIHGNRSQGQRSRALKGFQDGEFRVLVCTDVAARGLHIEAVAHVINFDVPKVPEDFIHRVGRTGRAGLKGVATTFVTRAEWNDVRRIERNLNVRLERQMVNAADKAAIAAIPERIAMAPTPKLELVHNAPARRPFSGGGRPAGGSFGAKKTFSSRPKKFSAR